MFVVRLVFFLFILIFCLFVVLCFALLLFVVPFVCLLRFCDSLSFVCLFISCLFVCLLILRSAPSLPVRRRLPVLRLRPRCIMLVLTRRRRSLSCPFRAPAPLVRHSLGPPSLLARCSPLLRSPSPPLPRSRRRALSSLRLPPRHPVLSLTSRPSLSVRPPLLHRLCRALSSPVSPSLPVFSLF